MVNMQKKQKEWEWQWGRYHDQSLWLFREWIWPNKLEDFRGKSVADCGCGSGQHLNFVAPYARLVVGIDLNTADIARRNNRHNKNVSVIEGDIAKIRLGKKFDVVYSVGVLQHTNDPSKSFNNIKKLAKRGGRVIVWVYSHEGNLLNRAILEPLKQIFFLRLNKNVLSLASIFITALLYAIVYSLYLLPLKFLPFYEYFQNFRKLGFERNNLNVFDKLNAPTTNFIKRETMEQWFSKKEFSKVHLSHYKGVSWRASGTKI